MERLKVADAEPVMRQRPWGYRQVPKSIEKSTRQNLRKTRHERIM
jgi:hypothetical protein